MLDNYESMMNSLTEVLKSSAPQIMAYVSGVASNVVDIFTALASSVDVYKRQVKNVDGAVLIVSAVPVPAAAQPAEQLH